MPCAIHLSLEGFPGLFLFHKLVASTSFSFISEVNRLPAFHPAASSHQQKLSFDTFALCFWHLIDTAVSGSSWHLMPAAMLPQAVSSSRPHAEKGTSNSVSARHSARTAPIQHNRISCLWSLLPLHTRAGSSLAPVSQGHHCLSPLQSLSPCWSRESSNLSNCSRVPHNYSFCQIPLFPAVNCCIPILCL